jgi:hypothetical protein
VPLEHRAVPAAVSLGPRLCGVDDVPAELFVVRGGAGGDQLVEIMTIATGALADPPVVAFITLTPEAARQLAAALTTVAGPHP